MERQTSTTSCETVISVEDPSSSPTTSSIRSSSKPIAAPVITEEATIFDISSLNTISQNCSSDEEHQVDGTYAKATIR
jgi:hypothetical protein